MRRRSDEAGTPAPETPLATACNAFSIGSKGCGALASRPEAGAGTYRPIYTLHVTSTDEGPPIRRETVLILDVPGAPFRILDSR